MKNVNKSVPSFTSDCSSATGSLSNEGQTLKSGNGVDVNEQDLLDKHPDVLRVLLKDHTRTRYVKAEMAKKGQKAAKDFQKNIIWGTNNYLAEGDAYGEKKEIAETLITGAHGKLVRPRALKDADVQRQRSRDMAEVFTPAWVCNAQNNLVDDAWFGRTGVFNVESVDTSGKHVWQPTVGPIVFDEKPSKVSTKSWQDYVRDIRLEITCGEAPYLVSRYDVTEGNKLIPLERRVGLLDRKLRVVTENTKKRAEWLKWAKEAVKSIYGFEWQGDNLLLAREAVLATVLDYYEARSKKVTELEESELMEFAEIISWNLWQMDGLRMVLPYSCEHAKQLVQMDMFAVAGSEKAKCAACLNGDRTGHIGIKCLIRDWSKKADEQVIEFESLFKANTSRGMETANER